MQIRGGSAIVPGRFQCDERLRLRRHPPGPPTRERAGEGLRARLRGARRAQGAAREHGQGARADPAHHRRARGRKRRRRPGRDAARPRARARPLAEGRRRARGAGDRGGGGGAPRVVALALGGPRGRVPAGGGAARHHLAGHGQRGDDAGTVEDRLPGRDRLGRRARRLLALQPALRRSSSTPSSRSRTPRCGTSSITGRSRASSTR